MLMELVVLRSLGIVDEMRRLVPALLAPCGVTHFSSPARRGVTLPAGTQRVGTMPHAQRDSMPRSFVGQLGAEPFVRSSFSERVKGLP